MTEAIAVIMTAEDVSHVVFLKQGEIASPNGGGQVEVLVRLIGCSEEPGMVLKDDDVMSAILSGFLQLPFQPMFLLGEECLRSSRSFDETRIKDDPHEILMTKRVMIRPELVGKRGDGLGCGLVADIVVAGNVVNGDVRINFGEDAFEFVNLGGVTG